MNIFTIDPQSRSAVNEFIMQHWYTTNMVVHGESIDLSHALGFYAMQGDEITGLITYRIIGDVMEILSLDSVHENRGTGTALLNAAIGEARRLNCRRVTLITTNDNLHALRFYQKRGFDMIALYRNALDESRKLKPEIPRLGLDGIPLQHEIELEMTL